MASPAPLQILLIEDDDQHYDLVERLLIRSKRPRFKVTRAMTVQEGRELLDQNSYSAVLSDLNLPDSAASETIDTIGQAFRDVPVLVLTSMEERGLVSEAAHRGAQEFIDKFTLDQKSLVRSIEYAIERKKNLNLLESQNAELKHFSHTIAHEIRNPASAMAMTLELLRENLKGTDALSEEMEMLLNQGIASGSVLNATIDEMLHFAEAEGSVFEKTEVDLPDLVKFVINQTVIATDAPRDTFATELKTQTIYGNEVLLRQMISNLVSNAWRYRGQCEKPAIIIKAHTEDDKTVVEVVDNGIGIRKSSIKKIFQLFYREKEDPTVKGSGIGLGFCKTVVEKHDGEISVQSEVGKGSTFTIKLPNPTS